MLNWPADVNLFLPVVHYANRLVCRPGEQFGPRTISDYQWIFVQSGKGVVRIGCRTFRVSAGSLLSYGPGEPHFIKASEDDPFVLYGLHFVPIGELSETVENGLTRIDPFETDWGKEREEGDRVDEFPGGHPDPPSAVRGLPPHLKTGMWPLAYFESFVREFHDDAPLAPAYLRGQLIQLTVQLLRWLKANESAQLSSDASVVSLARLLEAHAEETYDPGWMEEWTAYSREYISRMFRKRFGLPPNAYHARQKALAARRMLIETHLSVTEIAERLHFAGIHYFCKWFRRQTGERPTAFRIRNRLL